LLVAGAGGMLGRDVVLAAQLARHDVRALDRVHLDITQDEAVQRAVADFRPGAVINCAAFTAVNDAEEAEDEAMLVNAEGARILATAGHAVGAKIVYVSTDYVFDGEKKTPYVESDEPAPLSVYGRSKLAGETYTATVNPRAFIVRSAWMFGQNGSNFVERMLQLAADHGEVLAVRDQVGSPTYTGHLAVGVIRLIEGEAFGIHHMAGEGECSFYDFAREIFDQARVECSVLSATTDMFPGAPRPAYSALASQRRHAITLPPWRDGISAYLAERRAMASDTSAESIE
jgi:dTDP-4-dehydrorhamnose reductase